MGHTTFAVAGAALIGGATLGLTSKANAAESHRIVKPFFSQPCATPATVTAPPFCVRKLHQHTYVTRTLPYSSGGVVAMVVDVVAVVLLLWPLRWWWLWWWWLLW